MGNGASINLVYFFSVEFTSECFQRMIELFCDALVMDHVAVFAKIRGEAAWMSAERLEKGPVPLPPRGKAHSLQSGEQHHCPSSVQIWCRAAGQLPPPATPSPGFALPYVFRFPPPR